MDIDTKALEDKWKKFWFQNKLFSLSDFSLPRERYFTIDTPPPTVSGKMHIGHAFSYSHQDFIARYKRMRGFLVFYPWGFDDNGLPTERFTESERGVKAENIEPKVFVEMCRETSEMAEKRLRENWRSLGITADLDNNYRTISPESQKISQLMFKDLLKKGRVYRDEAPTIRCPTCLTAISQIELKDKELETDFVYVKFEGKAGGITIATTRPELIGACVAVAVNPSDARYAGLIGSLVLVPIYGREVPVIGDDIVDKEKGTGAEMICTFGDQNDVAVWRAHSLDTRVIIDRFGRITDDGDFLKGLHVKEARRRMIRELSERGLIVKMERIRHSVNVHERCNTPVEIGISKQWFVRYLDLKDELIRFDSNINWIPSHMRTRLQNWINGLKWDWCISRQRFLGVPFPVWYCRKCGEVNAAPDDSLPIDPRSDPVPSGMVCRKCGSSDFEPETDVMDTWATSSLSPRLAFRGSGAFEKMIPFDCRFQGHDIISFWAFTTIVRSYIHDGVIPWNSIVISGNVYDAEGIKMSKSKGNVVEPEDVISKYGADALRYWASTTAIGEDIRLKEQDLVRGKRTMIKLYNAARLVKTLSQNNGNPTREMKYPWNIWIWSLLDNLIDRATDLMDNYEISKARTYLDNFFWNDYCDNYLEISKVVMAGEGFSNDEKAETSSCLLSTMFAIIKMYSIIMPFITEEIYHDLGGRMQSVSLDSWPEPVPLSQESRKVAQKFGEVINVIGNIRSLKTSLKLSMGAPLDRVLVKGNVSVLRENEKLIKGIMRISRLEIEESDVVEAYVD